MSDSTNRHAIGKSCIALAVITVSLASGLVQAQSSVLEEVVVTARKRMESMQETPVAVSAFSGNALREAGISNLSDFGKIVPNMDVANGSGTTGQGSIFIRGVGQRNSGVQIDSGVGIYLDDVYIARSDGALLDIKDIASVQVLRGPQGTLFGKNTTGGAVVFSTNKPQDEYEGKVMLRAGNYNRRDGELMLNIPLSDAVFARFSGAVVNRDGYMKNVVDGRMYTDEDRMSGIAQLRWLASDAVILDLNLNYSKTDQMTRGQQCQVIPGAEGWEATLRKPLYIRMFGKTGPELCAQSQALDSDEFMSDAVTRYYSENTGASATIQWDINETMSFKSVTAWRNTDARDSSDLDSIHAPSLLGTDLDHPAATGRKTDQYTQELQLLGEAFGGRATWVTGLFWFKEESKSSRINELGPWFIGDLGDLELVNFRAINNHKKVDNSAIAVFAQADWAFTDAWEMTLGLRYTQEDRSMKLTAWSDLNPESITTGETLIALPSDTWAIEPGSFNHLYEFIEPTLEDREKVSANDWSPTFSLKYLFGGGDLINGGSAYFSATRGFLSGGISEGPTKALEIFEAEEVENIELGVKIDTWDRRLRINAALFNTQYTNRQLTSLVVNPNTGGVASVTVNAAKSSIRGFELETTLLPVQNLELTFNGTWNDGDIDEFDDVQIRNFTGDTRCLPGLGGKVEACAVDRSDENLPRLPDQIYFLSAQYFWQTEIGTIIPRIQWSLKKNVESCFDRTSCLSGLWNDDQEDLSARVTWRSTNEQWVASAYGSNLTNEEHANGGIPLGDNNGFGGLTTAPPRMYGVEVSYQW